MIRTTGIKFEVPIGYIKRKYEIIFARLTYQKSVKKSHPFVLLFQFINKIV